MNLLKQALTTTTKLASFVVFILVGSTIFSLVFQGVDGQKWVEHLLTGLPGGQVGFLIVVNVLIFGLAFFLDFFELSFIVVPCSARWRKKAGRRPDLVGVLLGVNMQTIVHAPPFGFALFYLRSVAPDKIHRTALPRQDHCPGHHHADLLGCRTVCADPDHHGRSDHLLPRHRLRWPGQGRKIDVDLNNRCNCPTKLPCRAGTSARTAATGASAPADADDPLKALLQDAVEKDPEGK